MGQHGKWVGGWVNKWVNIESTSEWTSEQVSERTSEQKSDRTSERARFNGLFGHSRRRGPYSPYKPCNHSLYIGIIILPHIDNTQSTGHN